MSSDEMKPPPTLAKAITRFVSLLSPNCKQASHLQTESFDRSLTFFESLGLRLHLALCKWCRRYGEQIKFLRQAALQSEQDQQQTSNLRLAPEARERIKQKLQSE